MSLPLAEFSYIIDTKVVANHHYYHHRNDSSVMQETHDQEDANESDYTLAQLSPHKILPISAEAEKAFGMSTINSMLKDLFQATMSRGSSGTIMRDRPCKEIIIFANRMTNVFV